MDIDHLAFDRTGYFTPLICDYLAKDQNIKGLYHRYPELDSFGGQIAEKTAHFPDANRALLYDVLREQYKGTEMTPETESHLKKLKEPISFTVVTGHQLNLFSGPLYFLYKIISTIKLTKSLKKAYPKYNFVPIYWMATEDHDFEEINFFNFKGKKLQWNKEASGAVGDLDTVGLSDVSDAFANALGGSDNADRLKTLFRMAYLEHDTLTAATRYLANALFGDYGLVILDGDHPALKKLMIPYAQKDIFERIPFQKVSEAIAKLEGLSENYTIQVNPREINYFYLKEGFRERIIEQGGTYFIDNTEIRFSRDDLQQELDRHPERFSPNVITRPVYQEVVLPNLCYIGGGGEIAYWLQLKSTFEALEVPFPVLLLRNSALVITEKQKKKLQRMNLKVVDLFLKQSSLINKKIREISNIDIDFSPQKRYLEEQFQDLYDLAEQTDKSFLGAVKAQEVKQKKGLDNLEGRLLRAQKRKLEDQVRRMTEIQNALFPNQSLQERHLNFSELYLELGDDLIPLLMEALDPLRLEFTLLEV
ncbi:bacillithiol biosynthesis cysteine-adding enzyme BshC [Pricia sp. S334]|uniref:Putative cysteine ligase BshC n=1 Tax=Pricia mediterranea TaxID=3076079 RepID=A0ABU3L1K9_9FLAO|nr:bacillithiol biosynthesis cysteine-adding enzyme BshC [Pricia sp. S334]MDT7827616.1 bacillithiol biosynthesis cysteine-adding enzyme BshC [Pricia sp. S334]